MIKIKKLTSGLLALGLSASLFFQTPVFAAEETTQDAAVQDTGSAVSTNSIPAFIISSAACSYEYDISSSHLTLHYRISHFPCGCDKFSLPNGKASARLKI